MSKDRTGDEEIDGKLVVTDSIRTTNVTANRIDINVSTFVCDFQFGDATPQFAIYDSDIDLVHATFAAIDSAAFTIEIKSNNPLLTFYGADGAADAWAMTLNTSDQALFTGASGGYVYDDDLLPDTDVTYDLGTAALQWDSLHVGDVKASVNVQGATYGSDASISDAELLTIDDGAVTEILVGGGAGSAPVWTTATGTGAPVRAGSPTFTGTLGAADLNYTGHRDGKVFTVNNFQYPVPATEWAPALTGANCPASQTAVLCWIPLNFLIVGDEITTFNVVGDATETNALTLDAQIYSINKADPITTTAVANGAMTQVDTGGNFDVVVNTDDITVATDKQYAIQLTATTGVGDVITVMGVEITINRK